MISEKKYLSTFFFLLFLFSVIKLTDNAINLDAWEYGEWLINYQEGFIRRGLIGELIFNFSNLFKMAGVALEMTKRGEMTPLLIKRWVNPRSLVTM